MLRPKILLVEDIATLAMTYASHLERAGMAVTIAGSGAAALAALGEAGAGYAAVVLDLQLPDGDGLELLGANRWLVSHLPVIVITADASVPRAIAAMRLGAFDFLVKPLAASRLIHVVTSAVESGRGAGAAGVSSAVPGDFIGTSPAMLGVYAQIRQLARSRASVFVTGESGTGKELCAEAIHREGSRADGKLVAINCGAIPEHLLESEIFGHVKGAFTGAVENRIGAAQLAHKGTLFLDEICEMALPLQVKLLRFLQSGTIQRVGSARVEPVDVRIICATNRDPRAEVAAGRFREDLYYRLAVVPLHMPPLRERGDDVVALACALLARFAKEEGKRFGPPSAEALARLKAWHWPGNVRELQNVLRRAVVLGQGPELPLSMLPSGPVLAVEQAPRPQMRHTPPPMHGRLAEMMRGMTLDEVERIAIDSAIDAAGGSLPGAARLLGLSPSTLYRKRERWTRQTGHAA